MSASDSLSVVIVSYNTRELLRACLQALQAVPLSLEVMVVDNASQDSSAQMVAADFPHEFPLGTLCLSFYNAAHIQHVSTTNVISLYRKFHCANDHTYTLVLGYRTH